MSSLFILTVNAVWVQTYIEKVLETVPAKVPSKIKLQI